MVHSSTEIAVQALGFALPVLEPSPHDTPCGLCGSPLQKGVTPARPFSTTAEFAAFDHLHPHRSALICGPCAVATSTTTGFMNRFSRAVFTLDHAYRLSSAEDISWMILHAQPPFVAAFNMRASAHVLWQCPVTHDRAAISVSFGSVVGSLRPAAVLDARLALARLAVAGNEALNAHFQWPVFNLSLYDDVTDACRLIPSHERVLRASPDEVVKANLALIDTLNQTERWALSALLLARPRRSQSLDDIERPPILHRNRPVTSS